MITRATFNDLGFGIVAGLLVALSPFTSPRFFESVLGGVLAGGAIFAFRHYSRIRSGVVEEGDDEAISISLPPASVCIALALFAILFYPTFHWLLTRSMASVWTNGHGLFTPFIMGFLAVQALRKFEGSEPTGSAWGFVFVVLGVVLLLLDLIPSTYYMASFGLILCLPGLSLLFLGVPRTKALALPLSLGMFMIPIPLTVGQHVYLQLASAAGTVPLLRILGFPVYRDGTVLQLGTFSVEVSQACSGFSALYAGVFLGVILVAYSPSPLRKLCMALAVVPVAIASNILRVLFLVLIVHYTDTSVLDTAIHPASGAVSFWLVMIGLFLIAGRKTIRAIIA